MRRFWDAVLRFLGVSVEHFDLEPAQVAGSHWALKPLPQWKRSECAAAEGRPFKRPAGQAAPGYFWKRDAAGAAYRLYRDPRPYAAD